MAQARAAGHDLSGTTSVASFFVSRVGTEVDERLDETGAPQAVPVAGRRTEGGRTSYGLVSFGA